MSPPGAPRVPEGSPGTVLAQHQRGWAGFGGADPATGGSGGWDGPSRCPPVPVRDRAGHGPEAAAGEGGSRAEPGDSRAMAFPERGPGDVGEQKELSVLRPRAGQAGWDGWGWIWELCTPSRPVPSHPVLSQPTTPMGPL